MTFNDYDKLIKVDLPWYFLPKQLEVLKAIEKASSVLYSGAFRAGKTLLLTRAAIIVCLMHSGCKGLLASQTYTQLKAVVFNLFLDQLDEVQSMLDKQGIHLRLAKSILRSQTDMSVTFFNGSMVYFRSCDDERKLAGYTLDFFGIDEPVDVAEDVYLQLTGRLSGTKDINGKKHLNNCFALLTTNPGDELHWLYKKFYWVGSEERGYIHVDTTTYDNRLLPDYDNYIKRKEEEWGEDWIRRYLNGKWGMFEGAIYKSFNPEKHVKSTKDIPVSYYIASVDWGLRDPYCVLIAGITADNRIIVKEEIYGNDKASPELAKIIANKHKEFNFRKVYIDPSAADLIKQTYELGVPSGKKTNDGIKSFADRDIVSGISRNNGIFKSNLVIVDPSCDFFIKEHRAYRYEQGKDKPVDKNNHSCDAFRYLTTDFTPNSTSIGFGCSRWNKWRK